MQVYVQRPLVARTAGKRRLGWNALSLALALAATIVGGQTAYGQVTQLEDLVPLQQLETPTDDLIRLATAYTEGLAELENANLSVETLNSLRPNAVVTALEIRIAQNNVRAAQRKVQLFRAMIEKQLAAAEAKLEILRWLDAEREKLQAGTSAKAGGKILTAQAVATVEILKMILETK